MGLQPPPQEGGHRRAAGGRRGPREERGARQGDEEDAEEALRLREADLGTVRRRTEAGKCDVEIFWNR